MEKQPISQLEEKILLLIENYKSLKKEHATLLDEAEKLKKQNSDNSGTIDTLQKKLSELEKDLAEKSKSLDIAEKKCAEYEDKIANYESVTKTASTRIDDILSQLSQL
ncbi:MAG: hypothetical protein K0B81_06240 [Candidatus Cloacimonetes bacterium]|nr:hypothetical protein [Candidatus Cloacimonadota bacterium]